MTKTRDSAGQDPGFVVQRLKAAAAKVRRLVTPDVSGAYLT
ncbi:hypothetical protein [Sphingomonas sp. Leaf357]|nr:hypothetical protein [Sphingomonas sp. Leaf357]